MSLKTCRRCKQEKPVTQFGPAKGNRDGLHNSCKACVNAAQNAKRHADPIKSRATRIMTVYGVTRDEAFALAKRQETDPCEICGRQRFLHVDHDHDTHVVRGLLCMPCNAAIGLLQDSPDVVMAAALYLRTHKGGV